MRLLGFVTGPIRRRLDPGSAVPLDVLVLALMGALSIVVVVHARGAAWARGASDPAGPAFLPVAAAVMILVGVLVALAEMRTRGTPALVAARYRVLAIPLLVPAVYIRSLLAIGFVVTTAAVLSAFLYLCRAGTVRYCLALGASATLVLFAFFVLGVDIFIPNAWLF